MAFFFTLLFIVVAYVTPGVIFGALSQFHMEIVVAILAFVTSVPNLVQSRLNQAPQTYAFFAFCVIVPLSVLSNGWISGAAGTLYGILPVVFCFLLPAANFRTRQQLQWLVLAMLLCSAYFMYMGLQDLYNNVVPSLYLYGDGALRRLRGLGFVFDPNDFSQVMVSLLPMVFLWKKRNWLLNIFLLGVPIAVLITGMFYTHSRGAALALMATLIIALRRKIGTVPAVVLAGGLFAASLAIGWSGGRDVSVEAGGDRLDAWSTGLELIKHHPVLGVGAGQFAEHNDITAHNSVVVCAAEIGLPGFVCWVFMIFATFRGLFAIQSAKPEAQEAPASVPTPRTAQHNLRPRFAHLRGEPAIDKPSPTFLFQSFAMAGSAPALRMPVASPRGLHRFGTVAPSVPAANEERQEDIRRMARLLVCSLTGFLVAGWFLSRALSMWLFLYMGIAEALFQMATDAGMQPRRDPFGFLVRWSAVVSVGLLAMVYGILKFRALTGR